MRSKLEEEETPNVDMAAMMDCIFLLLIFFLVAATIKKKHQELPITLPSGKSVVRVTAPDDTIVVSVVRRFGSQKIEYSLATVGERMRSTGGNREMVTFQELITELRKAAKAMPNRAVRIDADINIPYGEISQIMDHLAIYQLKNVGLRTKD